MLRAGGKEINSGGIDGAVPQQVRQLYNVAGRFIKGDGKQMPQVVGKNLGSLYPMSLS